MSGNTVPIDLDLDPRELERDLNPLEQGDIAPAQPAESTRPRLELVPRIFQRGAHSPLFMAVVSIGTIAFIFAAQLFLSIFTSQGAYEVSRLELQERDLTRVERAITQHVDKLASPQNLAENATQLGMVVNATPSYLRLSDAAVLGEIATRTRASQANTVPNELLTNMPLVSAEGLLVDRKSSELGVDKKQLPLAPVAWEGPLPAPNTH